MEISSLGGGMRYTECNSGFVCVGVTAGNEYDVDDVGDVFRRHNGPANRRRLLHPSAQLQ